MDINTMQLRPHHLLDIITDYGHGKEFKSHPYGHAVHTVAKEALPNVDLPVEFIVGADDICQPCIHLQPDGQCDDILQHLNPPMRKQDYNDDLDHRLLTYLDMTPGTQLTVRKFLEMVDAHMPGIEKICTHTRETENARLEGLRKGLIKLGITKA